MVRFLPLSQTLLYSVAWWDKDIFDNRWLLRLEEIWNVDACGKFILTISPVDMQPARKAAGTVEVSLENRCLSINPTETSLSAESFIKKFSRKQSVSKTPFYSIPTLQKIGQSARYRRERRSRPSDMLAAYAAIVGINRTSSPES